MYSPGLSPGETTNDMAGNNSEQQVSSAESRPNRMDAVMSILGASAVND
jgi:hypothetical protein